MGTPLTSLPTGAAAYPDSQFFFPDLPVAHLEEEASAKWSNHSAAISIGTFVVVVLAVAAFILGRSTHLPVAHLEEEASAKWSNHSAAISIGTFVVVVLAVAAFILGRSTRASGVQLLSAEM
ncbi:hypothetical protein CB1_002683001 [Camelus ferus]|nr:hypothetical protein CB1_002683001 [Camelus ferus]